MDELTQLQLTDSIVWLHVRNGLTALATKHFLNRQFYGREEAEMKTLFKTNVSNNVLFHANDALIDTSIVGTYEHVLSHNERFTPKIDNEDIQELRKHRIVRSHPGEIEFSDPKVQAFFKDHDHYRDNVALRLWRIRNDILEKVRARGGEIKFPLQVALQSGTLETIQGALNVSYLDTTKPMTLEELWAVVPGYFTKFEEALRTVTAGGQR